MRIACIISKVRVSGGAERVMCELCNALAERGHEIHLITQEEQKGSTYYLSKEIIMETTSVKTKVRGLRGVLRNRKLHKILKEGNFDVAVSFITEMNVLSIIASKNTGVPIVVSERVDPNVYNGTFIGILRSIIYPHADGFVFQTDEAKHCFSKKIQNAAAVIPNPLVDMTEQKTNYSTSNKIVAVGRLSKQKNYPFMLRAFSEFIKSYPNYSLEIFGTGDLKTELEQLSIDLKCNDSVKFMGIKNDVHKYMKDADIYLMTSDYEGISNALAEAMAIGLPVVSTNCRGGGASFLVKTEENGYLVDCGDLDKFISKMEMLASNEDLRRKIGTNATQIKDMLRKDVIFDQWEKYLTIVAYANKK